MSGRPDPARATSADVARLAGVSRATVSFVLNDTEPGRVSDATRARVRAAAEQLGYVSNAAARALRAGRSNLVLMPATQAAIGRLVSDWLDDLQQALHEYGYTLVLHGGRGAGPVEVARAWAEMRPAAVLAPVPGLTPAAVELLHTAGVRAVIATGGEPVPGAHTLIFRQEELGRLAAAHLIERGRRRLAVLMPGERGLDAFAAERLAGVRLAAEGQGVEVTPVPLRYDWDDALALARSWPGFDGVFGYNDDYALLLVRALQEVGLEVPGAVAVAGADDLLPGRIARPALTSVRIDLSGAGELAALVHRLIEEPAEAGVVDTVRMQLIVRDST
ncbi:DNA-binding LacI/PurR family transcriptional regulator [Actinoplanes octamycinicus]|uniref:DNA-binding LacI/PurR family transcriptional regulator n=1 Tax=Actinoplanes octamycinicus TaxID=135948 RepID=A0A7W7H460_9ACTN|nr:LacI family DNA-binding transcriptional regulator [Actinoplanes octamycinicus]MBB4743636.1 DNA-binding LacI/PurR family transcriptional regulator [Actinoplanes octamycinicus]GIE61061.1 LacI family transcriptional regulator [Actinoplanes octamycinicus]